MHTLFIIVTLLTAVSIVFASIFSVVRFKSDQFINISIALRPLSKFRGRPFIINCRCHLRVLGISKIRYIVIPIVFYSLYHALLTLVEGEALERGRVNVCRSGCMILVR